MKAGYLIALVLVLIGLAFVVGAAWDGLEELLNGLQTMRIGE